MPATVMLPNGFEPEGITIGRDATAYVGSVGSGAIYKVNLATGEGNIFVPAHETQRVAGMTYDRRTDLLYVAGIESGNGLVYDGLTGEQVAEAQFTSGANGLVNDAALSDDAIFFTDSYLPVVYRLPLDPESHLPDPAASETISLTGDFENLPDGLNSNGIVASADGAKLIVAHSDLGKLYMVDAASGEATELALDSEVQPYHDGLALDGDTLYVVDSTVAKIMSTS
jgi:sugar lactone lactonase YvrE